MSARGRRIAIVAARFNDFIVASLLKGAQGAWLERGGAAQDLTVVRVPGAFELPVVTRKLATSGRYEAVVALGCVIRGDTPHFGYVAGEVRARAAARRPRDRGKLPARIRSAGRWTRWNRRFLERAATTAGNKGGEAMESALEMAAVMARL